MPLPLVAGAIFGAGVMIADAIESTGKKSTKTPKAKKATKKATTTTSKPKATIKKKNTPKATVKKPRPSAPKKGSSDAAVKKMLHHSSMALAAGREYKAAKAKKK
eukprot:COSAG02_NODE_6458_length_3558_cov_2.844753_5_plen_105_part_00